MTPGLWTIEIFTHASTAVRGDGIAQAEADAAVLAEIVPEPSASAGAIAVLLCLSVMRARRPRDVWCSEYMIVPSAE